jgi:hypothetical protein
VVLAVASLAGCRYPYYAWAFPPSSSARIRLGVGLDVGAFFASGPGLQQEAFAEVSLVLYQILLVYYHPGRHWLQHHRRRQ